MLKKKRCKVCKQINQLARNSKKFHKYLKEHPGAKFCGACGSVLLKEKVNYGDGCDNVPYIVG